MVEISESDISANNVRRVINSLFDEGCDREAASFTIAIDGLEYFDRPHVRVELLKDRNKTGALVMFERSSSMQKFYSAIGHRLTIDDLTYKDCTRAGQRYLSIKETLGAADVIHLLTGLEKESFGAPLLVDFLRNERSTLRALFSRQPALAILSALSFIGVWIAFLIYETLGLQKVGPPSLVNVDKTEFLLGVLGIGLMVYMRATSRVQRTKRRPLWAHVFITLPLIIAFLTV